MAGGFASSEGAPDFEQSAPNGNTGKLGRKRERMSVHKSNDAGQFSGFSMYFEHQELDESSYPNDYHRQIKEEPKDDDDAIPFMVGYGDEFESVDTDVKVMGNDTARADSAKRDYRNLHTPGGRAAVSRPVSIELNSDDEIIVSMKRKRISDRKIADYLRDTGRVNYNPKTIGTRFMRIRAKLARARDLELDQGTATWSPKDDQNLVKAVYAAESNISNMKITAEKAKWDLASRELLKIDKGSEYSSRACKERFENLQSGKVVSPATAPVLDTPAQHEVQRLEKLINYYTQKLGEAKMDAQKEIDNVFGSPFIDSPTPYGQQAMDPNAEFSPSGRAMDVDADLTGLDTWMLRSMRIAEQDAQLEKRLGGLKLPEVDEMTSIELSAELTARGLARDGNKQKLVSLVKAARAGARDLQKSILPADTAALRSLLAKRGKKEQATKKRVDDEGDEYKGPATKKRRLRD